MEQKMKIIVCLCTQTKLNNSGIKFEVSNIFHCHCPFNAHILLFPDRNIRYLNEFVVVAIETLFSIANAIGLSVLSIVEIVQI